MSGCSRPERESTTPAAAPPEETADYTIRIGTGLVELDYTRFGRESWTPPAVVETIEMTFTKDNAALDEFNQWRINGHGVPDGEKGADVHAPARPPIHFHRQTFEVVSVAGRPAGGVVKDVVMLNGYQVMDIDFIANATGLSLFHCHPQFEPDLKALKRKLGLR